MSFTYRIDDSELKSWIKNSAHRNAAAKQAMILIKNDVVDKTRFVANNVNSSGKLKDSIMGTANISSVKIYSLGYGEIALETGRGPGGRPPTQAIENWVQQKLGISGSVNGGQSESYWIATKIANKIAASGTRKYRIGGPKYLTLVMTYLDKVFIPKHLIKLLDEYTK